MQQSRPVTPSFARSVSPSKQISRTPGRPSLIKEPPLPVVPLPRSLYAPPKAFVRGTDARVVRSNVGASDYSSKTVSQSSNYGGQARLAKDPSNTSKSLRLNPSGRGGSATSFANDDKISLDSIFKPPTPAGGAADRRKADRVGTIGRKANAGNNLALCTASKLALKSHGNTLSCSSTQAPVKSIESSSKSSSALRETIAKAKASQRAARSMRSSNATTFGNDTFAQGVDPCARYATLAATTRSDKDSVHKRLDAAVVSGSLKLAAMDLKQIPNEVLKMYDSTTSGVAWSEMVDITKFNAADNKIEHLGEDMFPDWSLDEVYNDDEKTSLFARVEMLDFHNNILQTIPVGLRRMERLTSLNLSGNQLSNQVLAVLWQIPRLQNLDLSHNGLAGAINLSTIGTDQLRILNLHDNQIDEIELSRGQVATLQKLDLSKNHLTKLPWDALAACDLVELNAAQNRLDGIAFAEALGGYQKLAALDLSCNAFSSLDPVASDFESLETCLMQSNQLTELPDISGWQLLKVLHLSNNKLVEVPTSLYGLSKVTHVDLGRNDIMMIDARLSTMGSLATLTLAGNPLREPRYLTMSTENLKLDLSKRLESPGEWSVSAHTNSAQKTPCSSDSQRTNTPAHKATGGILDLSNCGLSLVDLNLIDLSTPVHTLRLTNNDLRALPVELLRHPLLKQSLRLLDISHNPLHPVDYLTNQIDLPELRSLYVVSTGLTSLEAMFSNLKAPRLNELNISCHRLTGPIPPVRATYRECSTLSASDNWFSSISVESIKGLEVVDIRNNQIDHLPPIIGLLGTHHGMREPGKLRTFEVAGNPFRVPRVSVVEKGAEAILKDLRRMIPARDVPEEWREKI